MTAIRNFPDAPQALRSAAPIRWRMPAFVLKAWQALHRHGQRRAAWELNAHADRVALGNPLLASQLREAADECRRAALPPSAHNPVERSTS